MAKFVVRGVCCAMLMSFAGASAASAALPEKAPAVFDFTVGHNSSGINNVANGNARIYHATSPDLGAYSIRATAWTLKTSDNKVYASKLMVYSGGLGVISSLSNDDGTGSGGKHQVDNHVNKDFILLQFSRQVKLTSAVLNTYDLSGTRDSDAIVKFGTTPGFDWQNDIGLAGKMKTQLDAMFGGTLAYNTSSTGNRTVALNPDRFSGDLWLIGPSWNPPGSDTRVDAFKLASLAAIPEPATWAMMIGGFGLVGAAARRRVRMAASA
jgi:hypothetical protein